MFIQFTLNKFASIVFPLHLSAFCDCPNNIFTGTDFHSNGNIYVNKFVKANIESIIKKYSLWWGTTINELKLLPNCYWKFLVWGKLRIYTRWQELQKYLFLWAYFWYVLPLAGGRGQAMKMKTFSISSWWHRIKVILYMCPVRKELNFTSHVL